MGSGHSAILPCAQLCTGQQLDGYDEAPTTRAGASQVFASLYRSLDQDGKEVPYPLPESRRGVWPQLRPWGHRGQRGDDGTGVA